MLHTKSDYFKPPPDANFAPHISDLSKSPSIIGVKLKYTELSTGRSVRDLVTPISPRKAHVLSLPDIAFTYEILGGEEVSIKAQAPYPVNILVKVLHGEVKLGHCLRQDPDIKLLSLSGEILISTEILTIESISKFAILIIAAYL